MKKLKLLLLLLVLTGAAWGQIQHIKIVSFIVKNQLPPQVDNWGNTPGSLLLVAQKGPNARVEGVRLVLQIKGGGAIICGNNVSNGLPVDNNFTTRTFSAGELIGLLSNCHELKEGSYMLCAQFFNIDKVAISEEVCRPFTVEAPKEIEYNPPTLINPENGREFSTADMQKPVMFRWTPLVPKPRETVTYRLKVWQLMQGQNGTQAMRSNQPIVTKDVDNITQAVVNNIITGPCRPPYLCDFVWQVQALNKEGKPMGRNSGNSDPYSFKVKEGESNLTLSNQIPENNKQLSPEQAKGPVVFRWTPLVPKPRDPVTYRLKVWQLMQGQNGTEAMRSNPPIVVKDVDNITQTEVASLLRSGCTSGPCCPPYLCDFIWRVEALGANAAGTAPQVIATSEPTGFNVKAGETQGSLSNVFPEDKKQFTQEQMKSPVTFRWTPLVPKPSEPVTYRLKVWQLMQGQNGAQAMRSNQPIVTKDVDNLTQTEVSNILRSGCTSGPCCPPYLCDFIWNVEALTRGAAGQAAKVIATSNPTTFVVSQYIIQIDSIKVNCTDKPGVFSFSYTITNPNPGPATLNVLAVTSSVPAGASLGSFTPPVNTVINSGNQLTITGTINAAVNLSNICIGAEIKDVGNAFWKASKDTCVNVGPCKCTACDSVKIDINTKDIKFDANGNINLNTTVNVSPKTVKSFKAELVYFEYKPESDDCMLCNKDSKTYGNFDNGSLANTSPLGGGTHSLEWIFTPAKNLAGTGASMTITVPPTVKCCDANIKWCIRYVVVFNDCTVCNKLVCYEKRKEGCAKGNPNPNNDQK